MAPKYGHGTNHFMQFFVKLKDKTCFECLLPVEKIAPFCFPVPCLIPLVYKTVLIVTDDVHSLSSVRGQDIRGGQEIWRSHSID